MGLLDWLGDVLSPNSGPTGGTPMQPGPGGQMGNVDPMGNATGGTSPLPTPAPAPTGPMPPVQQLGADAPPISPDADGNPAAGFGGASVQPDPAADGNPAAGFGGARMPVPLPQPRPTMTPQAAPTPSPASAPQAGAPMSLAPPAPGASSPAQTPGQTWLGRALGITPDQAGANGRQFAAGLGAGLKAIGSGAGVGQGKFAAFAGGVGNAMEGAQKEAANQSKQATDYLNSAIKARQAGDEAGYKRAYLKYLAAKLQADTDKAASSTAGNKNDTPTQLYLNAQRLVQSDPEVRDASKALAEARKNGTPDEVAKAQAVLQQTMQAKQAQHYGALGLNPQTAAQIGKQPGNSIENPIDAGKAGITKDNITKKLQPGQYYTNPSDGKVYQFKGETKGQDKNGGSSMPDKPTNPEPIDPMKPYKTPTEGGGDGGGSDEED